MKLFKSMLEFWESGYIVQDGDYGAAIFGQYKYQVELFLHDFKTGKELYETEVFCREYFGELIETDANSTWQVCRNNEIQSGVIVNPKVIFLFHSEQDAFTFKMAWV